MEVGEVVVQVHIGDHGEHVVDEVKVEVVCEQVEQEQEEQHV